jgi:putative addiction module component (TIGR02574 family)
VPLPLRTHGKLAVTGQPAVDVERLTRDEQLELLDRLWESLGRDPEALPLSDEQRRGLDQRLDELEREGPAGMSWDEALLDIRSKSR